MGHWSKGEKMKGMLKKCVQNRSGIVREVSRNCSGIVQEFEKVLQLRMQNGLNLRNVPVAENDFEKNG